MESIQFFDTPSSCIAYYHEMHWAKKGQSWIKSCVTLFVYVCYRMYLMLSPREKKWIKSFTSTETSDLTKKKWIVCLHGLNNDPTQFKKIIRHIQRKRIDSALIYTPYILKKGNAPLDQMVAPIVQEITNWAKQGEGKELALVGVSNGGRIARAIEVAMANSSDCKSIQSIHVISIVGAARGSTIANLLNKLRLSWVISKPIAKEMPTYSDSIRKLNQEWEKSLIRTDNPKRTYTFIASPHDWQVPNYDSTLSPVVGHHRARYAIIPGHGHNSLTDAVAKEIVDIL